MRGARLTQAQPVSAADVEAEHYAALESMTGLQVAALNRLLSAMCMASFTPATTRGRLQGMFAAEAARRNAATG